MKDIKAHFYKNLYVADSQISGQGLFVDEDIMAGDAILSFGGTFALVYDRSSGKYIESTFTGVTDTIMICEEADSEKDLSDYINHSCNPNVGMYDCLTLIAIRNIKKGEELLCDYSFWEADENWILECECNCRSELCRKRITGRDWRKIHSTDKSFLYFAPFIQRRILKREGKT